jgi:hypothetical protein
VRKGVPECYSIGPKGHRVYNSGGARPFQRKSLRSALVLPVDAGRHEADEQRGRGIRGHRGDGREFSTMIATPDPEYWRFMSSDRPEPHELSDLISSVAFEPQAIVDEDISDLARRSDWQVVEGSDDLDAFSGVGFLLGDLPVAVMHYRGHPEHTSTIYLPFQMGGLDQITTAVARVMKVLKIPRERLKWQRRDGPPL